MRNAYIFCLLTLLSAISQAQPFPLELVGAEAQFSIDSRAVFSPDGRYVVFGVTEHSSEKTASLPGGAQIRKSWFPFDAASDRLFLVDTETSERYPLGPAESGAIRPSFSPDSQKIIFYVEDGDRTRLYQCQAPDWRGSFVGQIEVHPRKWPGDEARWIDSEQVLVETADRENSKWLHALAGSVGAGKNDEPVVYRTGTGQEKTESGYWQKIDAGIPTLVHLETGRAAAVPLPPDLPPPTISFLSPSRKRLAYFTVSSEPVDGETCSLIVSDAQSGAPILVKPNLELFYTKYPLLQWHPSRDRLFLNYDGAVQEVDFESGSFHRLGGILPDTSFFINPEKEAIVARSVESTLSLLPLDGSAPKTVELPESTSDIRSLGAGQVVALAGKSVYVVELSGEKPPKQVFEWRGGLTLWDVSEKTEKTLLSLESPNLAPDLFMIGLSGERKRLTQVSPEIDDLPILEVRRFKTSCEIEGKTVALETAVTLPPDFDPDHPPKAIYRLYPGARRSQDAETFKGPEIIPARVFCSRGYAVIDSDSPVGPHGQPGEIIQELVKVSQLQVEEAGRLGLIDPSKVAVMGHSKGAYSVLALCAATDLFRAGVATMGLYDISHSYADPHGVGPHYVESNFRADGSPWADTERYLRNSPFWRAEGVKEPIFMAAGSEDKATPAWQSISMWSAIDHHKGHAELVVYPGEDHSPRTWSDLHRVDLMRRIISFLDTNL